MALGVELPSPWVVHSTMRCGATASGNCGPNGQFGAAYGGRNRMGGCQLCRIPARGTCVRPRAQPPCVVPNPRVSHRGPGGNAIHQEGRHHQPLRLYSSGGRWSRRHPGWKRPRPPRGRAIPGKRTRPSEDEGRLLASGGARQQSNLRPRSDGGHCLRTRAGDGIRTHEW
jgi:hypothetical protein